MSLWIILFLVLSFLTTLALLSALALSKRTIDESPIVDEESLMMPNDEPLSDGAGWNLRPRNVNN